MLRLRMSMSGGASLRRQGIHDALPIASPAGSDAGRNGKPPARASTSWRMQAEKWLGATSRSGKLPVRHCASASGQRGWKRQPDGGSARSGGLPGDGLETRARRSGDRPVGTQLSKPGRVGMPRLAEDTSACRRVRRYGRNTSRRRAGNSAPRRPCRGSPGATASRRSRCSSASSLRIWSWIVTSSAVVGSSARMMRGLQASAAAMTTRWHMPPLNS